MSRLHRQPETTHLLGQCWGTTLLHAEAKHLAKVHWAGSSHYVALDLMMKDRKLYWKQFLNKEEAHKTWLPIVILKLHVASFEAASWAVQIIVVKPTPKSSPDATWLPESSKQAGVRIPSTVSLAEGSGVQTTATPLVWIPNWANAGLSGHAMVGASLSVRGSIGQWVNNYNNC